MIKKNKKLDQIKEQIRELEETKDEMLRKHIKSYGTIPENEFWSGIETLRWCIMEQGDEYSFSRLGYLRTFENAIREFFRETAASCFGNCIDRQIKFTNKYYEMTEKVRKQLLKLNVAIGGDSGGDLVDSFLLNGKVVYDDLMDGKFIFDSSCYNTFALGENYIRSRLTENAKIYCHRNMSYMNVKEWGEEDPKTPEGMHHSIHWAFYGDIEHSKKAFSEYNKIDTCGCDYSIFEPIDVGIKDNGKCFITLTLDDSLIAQIKIINWQNNLIYSWAIIHDDEVKTYSDFEYFAPEFKKTLYESRKYSSKIRTKKLERVI